MNTAIKYVITMQATLNQNDFHSWLLDNRSNLLELEKNQLSDAMMYAFDEDGHTGTWKQSVIDKYYNDKFANLNQDNILGHNKNIKDII
jgi:hypothetical protein